jgi:hypothetical protein
VGGRLLGFATGGGAPLIKSATGRRTGMPVCEVLEMDTRRDAITGDVVASLQKSRSPVTP